MAMQIEIEAIIERALKEDLGTGDVTSIPIIPSDTHLAGRFLVKEAGTIAGLEIARRVFEQLDQDIDYEIRIRDGSPVEPGDIVARVEGEGPSILMAERVALNFLQRMSGIASMTQRYVKAIAGTNAHILDTRKTVPGLRALDKMAVRIGGGHNHRMGLYDMVLIKDNHIIAAGSIESAVKAVRRDGKQLPIEVEVESFTQLERVLALDVNRIMLDNMSLADMRRAVEITAGRCELEASGGITLESIRAVAETGVDYISVGALTHSVNALDISLDITLARPETRGEL